MSGVGEQEKSHRYPWSRISESTEDLLLLASGVSLHGKAIDDVIVCSYHSSTGRNPSARVLVPQTVLEVA
jgi:hypothetical protein